MPEEYVYKIVVDDSDVDRTIDGIDKKIVAMTQRMDALFRNVGAGAGAGMQQAAQQAEQSAAQVGRAEAATAQQISRAQQQATQAVEQSVNRRTQASMRSARQAVADSRQIATARQQELRTAEQSANAARADADATRRAAQLKKRAFQDAQGASKAALTQQKQAAQDLAAAEKEGVQTAVQALQLRKTAADANVEATKTAEGEAKEAYTTSSRAAQDAAFRAKEAGKVRTTASRQSANAARNQRTAEDQLGRTTRRQAKEKRNAAKAERDAEKAFVRTTKTFTLQRNQLNQLARTHGSFNVVIGKSADEMNDLEKEVNDVIRADKQLSDEVDKLIAKQGRFQVGVGRQTFAGGPAPGVPRGQFRQAGFAAQRLGIPGAAAFGEAAAVGGAAGIGAAAVLLSTQKLLQVFQSLAGAARDAFAEIVTGAVDSAKEIEVARAQFGAFFEQDTAAAEAALGRLQQLSLELGENVVGIGRAFLPEVESLDQLEEVVKIATALARFQPEQGILGARIALQEALAGEFRSLQRRFEISPIAIDEIRGAFETGGVTALLESLQAELERTGRSVEDLSGTFAVSVGRIQERWRQLLQVIGDPIIETIKDELNGIDFELQRLQPDLALIGQGFGEVVSKLVELVGTEVESFLESFDPEAIFAVISALNRVVEALQIVIISLDAGAGGANALETVLYALAGSMLNLEGFLLGASLELARLRETFVNMVPAMMVFAEASDIVGKLMRGSIGLSADLTENYLDLLIAFTQSGSTLEEVEAALASYEDRIESFPKSLAEWQQSLERGNDEGEEAANTFLKMSQSLDELIVTQGEYEDAQERVNEVVNEFNIQAQLKFEKILLDARRARLDFEIEAAQKVVDLERKNARKVADIRGKFDQSIIDAAQDLTDREADIIRKHGRAVLDLEDDLNDKRLEEEEKYRDELERIRDRFNFQAFEAMLANDAKQLRQIRRRQEFEEQQARKNRDRGVRDIDQEIDDRQQKLDIALQRELEDARIVNARKIRDLAQSLDRQLDTQEEARRRDLQDQAVSERRKRAELTESLNQQLQDYETWWIERNRVTAEKTEADLELMRGYIEQARELMATLQTLGITFNPVTGFPELNFSVPTIQPETSGIREIRDLVFKLTQAFEFGQGGPTRTPEAIREEVEGFSVRELVAELEQLRRATELGQLFEGQDTERLLAIIPETTDLAQRLMTEQALQIGQQAGLSAQQVIDETLGLSMRQLEKWITDFIAKYAVPELPEFSIFGLTPQEILLGGAGAPQQIPGSPFIGGVPGQFTPLPGTAAPSPFSPFAPQIIGPQPLGPGGVSPFPTAGDVSAVQGHFFIPGGGNIPPAVPGQTQFIFPNVTDAPFVTPAGPEGIQGVPSFGQILGMGQVQGNNALLPGNLLGVNPAFGFDTEQFQMTLDQQVAAQVTAELLKRGEIEDTVAFAELMIEKQVLAVSGLLNEEVEEFRAASDAEIVILEDTLARQQEALERLRRDPQLEAEAEAVEQSIAIIEDALERQREAATEASQAIIDAEASAAQEAGEAQKEAIDTTLTAAERAAITKANAVAAGLDEETAAFVTAASEQTALVSTQEADEAAIRAEGRAGEIEAEAEHSEERLEQLGEGFEGESDILNDFWRDWIDLEQQGINQDLKLLAEWIRHRNALIDQAITNLPGGGGLPGVGGTDGTGDNQADLSALQSLAISQAEELGILTNFMRSDIMQMPYDELVSFIEYLQDQLGFRQLGGSFQPGQPIVVGESGMEIARFPGTGMIDPIRSLLFRTPPPVGVGGTTNIDRSTNLGGFNFPDPRGIPPNYIRMMETIASNVLRKSYAGR
jgi:hypothetical protein